MRVWVKSEFAIIQEALCLLVSQLGYSVETYLSENTDIALWDLNSLKPPYPSPDDIPTLALLSAHDADIAQLLHLRYRGVLKATDDKSTLKRALSSILQGEIWADRKHITLALDYSQMSPLTTREQQTLRLLAKGLSNKAIAEQLDITEGTVKVYVSRLFSKRGVNSRTELLAQLRSSYYT